MRTINDKERADRKKHAHPFDANITAFKLARTTFKQLSIEKYTNNVETTKGDMGKNLKRFLSFVKARTRKLRITTK